MFTLSATGKQDVENCQDSSTANGHFVSPLAESAPQSTMITSLPQEMLIKIFQEMDSVSRKRATRVSRVWYSLLRETLSLRIHVKLELGQWATLTEETVCLGIQHTIEHVTEKNLVQTVEFKDESNPDSPWKDSAPLPHWKHCDLAGQLLHVLREDCCCRDDGYQDRRYLFNRPNTPVSLPHCLVFCKILLPAWMVKSFLECRSHWDYIHYVEFCDVKVTDYSFFRWLHTETCVSPELDEALPRSVNCRIRCGKDLPDAWAEFMVQLEKGDPDLSDEEEQEYQCALQAVDMTYERGARHSLLFALEQNFGRVVTAEEIVHGLISPLAKRMIIAATDVLRDLDERRKRWRSPAAVNVEDVEYVDLDAANSEAGDEDELL